LNRWADVFGPLEPAPAGGWKIIEWLRRNLKEGRRIPRTRQLWIWGRPGIGKSHFLAKLEELLSMYEIPKDIEFYDQYCEGVYHMAYIDEYKGQKQLQWLNSWLDGHPLYLNQKGSGTRKRDNLPTIVLSNYDAKSVYHKAYADTYSSSSVDALLDRIEEVQVFKEDMDFVLLVLGTVLRELQSS